MGWIVLGRLRVCSLSTSLGSSLLHRSTAWQRLWCRYLRLINRRSAKPICITVTLYIFTLQAPLQPRYWTELATASTGLIIVGCCQCPVANMPSFFQHWNHLYPGGSCFITHIPFWPRLVFSVGLNAMRRCSSTISPVLVSAIASPMASQFAL